MTPCSSSSTPTDASRGRLASMANFLHTMVRITDPERSRAFYEALGFRFSRDMDIVRDGDLEATNYFFSIGDQENVLELTYNHDGRSYELGTGYGHIALGVADLGGTRAPTLAAWRRRTRSRRHVQRQRRGEQPPSSMSPPRLSRPGTRGSPSSSS